jgi:hypothetical protein
VSRDIPFLQKQVSRGNLFLVVYHIPGGYNSLMLPDLQLKDTVRMRKQHPCGSTDWKVTRLGADIGLECLGCGRRVMLTRRELARRAKTILPIPTEAGSVPKQP